MTTRHTPGPWVIEYKQIPVRFGGDMAEWGEFTVPGIIRKGNETYGCTVAILPGHSKEADARLIAAAPEQKFA